MPSETGSQYVLSGKTSIVTGNHKPVSSTRQSTRWPGSDPETKTKRQMKPTSSEEITDAIDSIAANYELRGVDNDMLSVFHALNRRIAELEKVVTQLCDIHP